MNTYVIVYEYEDPVAVFLATNDEEAERVRAAFHQKKGYGEFLTTQVCQVPLLVGGLSPLTEHTSVELTGTEDAKQQSA